MHGDVSWEALVFIGGLLVTVGGFVGFIVFYVLNREIKSEEKELKRRHEARSHFDQRLVVVEEAGEKRCAELAERIHTLELFNASLTAILKQMDKFQDQVDTRFDQLESKRRADMKDLHDKLEGILALTRANIPAGEYPR